MHVEPTYILRNATLSDAAEIAEIYNESIALGDATMDDIPYSSADVQAMMEDFSRRETFMVLEGGQAMIGWGLIKRYSSRPGYRFCCEISVYVRLREVNRGYGSYIMRALTSRCREYGYHHLVGKIAADNQLSLDFVAKMGFEKVGIQKEVGFTDGRWRDVVILQLVLRDVPPEIPVRLSVRET